MPSCHIGLPCIQFNLSLAKLLIGYGRAAVGSVLLSLAVPVVHTCEVESTLSMVSLSLRLSLVNCVRCIVV